MTPPIDQSQRAVRGGGCFNRQDSRFMAFVWKSLILRGGSWFSNQTAYLNMRIDTAAGVLSQFTGFRTFRPSRMTRP